MSRNRRFQVVRENYQTYKDQITGESERHLGRIAGQTAIAISIACCTKSLSDNSISVLITSLSILTGFAFTALFPIVSDTSVDLPEPRYSEDWDDIKRIRTLARFFRLNVAYFIPLTIITILILAIQMIKFEAPHFNAMTFLGLGDWGPPKWLPSLQVLHRIGKSVLVASAVLLIEEVMYTFYRMCFNALSILRIKDEYKEGRMRKRDY